MATNWATKVKQRDNWTCQECGVTADKVGKNGLHAHHIKPKCQGGKNTLENGITVCLSCHWSVYHSDGTYHLSTGFDRSSKKKISVFVTDEMKNAIDKAARENGYMISGIVKMALNDFIKKHQSEKPA